MTQLTVDIGGRPGFDCRGFCKYCYFKNVKDILPFGCKYCLPFTVGCDYCTRSVKEEYTGFKDLKTIGDEVLSQLQLLSGDLTRITISGGGDPSCYPELRDLIELLASLETPLHIGYTSGKGFDDPDIADFLIECGMQEISFTLFSSDPELRRRYMNDPTPEVSLEVFRRLAGKIEVYAAIVVVPGVNDREELFRTITWIEETGAKGVILMRYANSTEQGLILENSPIIPDQRVHTVDEFSDLVRDIAKKCNIRISGTPLCDPDLGSPFAILDEPDLIIKLPEIRKRATIITGEIAAPFIRKILSARGTGINVVATPKEIADLITISDLRRLDLSTLSHAIIIPGRAFVHIREAQEVLTADGIPREVIRGPDTLTADGETSMGMDRDGVLAMEMDGFFALINLINQYGE